MEVTLLASRERYWNILFLVMLGNIDQMNEHFENFLPNDLNVTDSGQKKQLGESMKSFYFDDKSISTDTTKEFMMVST